MTLLIVEYDEERKQFVCHRKGDTGMYAEGRGVSVAEAVGMWTIYATKYRVQCDPPELLEQLNVNIPDSGTIVWEAANRR